MDAAQRDRRNTTARARYAADPVRFRAAISKRRSGQTAHLRYPGRTTGERINHAERAEIITSQGGECAICRIDLANLKETAIHVDHDRETGKIRGVLCMGCNVGIGVFKDNPWVVLRAADYLNGHGKW